ncbi:non-hydrolyzing UDP-N-acetylglucosamine 2-epimerase [Rheinheimera sp. MMS21-TC3]|uniref:non-hydrolyzing UDP-N-acetylglucosamine 2-epimerase n=1 Tax=Rheinheimera sp. MMS21-TC3 TaxID=3072790 RepID=UPI0028C3B211|nr:UDP-N-acetylglucosamine 2-epimerase (non-hydrolyzing) [Rheinheimera sp. MMS21-TC3]WNO61696.1 UDP-N-acetylglucosamine 2-epimerase (non-hydrolyzing) [Rheinheimera sp. MMS21-TC3]
MLKIVTILGARPQFIKAGSVSREISKCDTLHEIIVHTGQHYDTNMSDVFFDEMQIPKPTYFLGIGGNSHGAMTGQMIEKIEQVLLKEKPDWVLVYGDTNSTLAGAIAASKLHIKVAHVEAGLRSFNMAMPEEVNRILTDRISSILFCPTKIAIQNLDNEGVSKWGARVELVGDVMQDGALFYKGLAVKPNNLELTGEFILSTIHRAENTDCIDRLTSIVESLNIIAKSIPIVLPLHPRTKSKLEGLQFKLSSSIKVISPVGYLNMVWLIDNCKLVMTDSGGLQKEAFFFSKPCITLRDETEWVELVHHNFNVLAGADKKNILSAFNEYIFNDQYGIDLYGNGFASNKIINSILNY